MNFTFEITSLPEAESRLLGLDDGRSPDHLVSIVNPEAAEPFGYGNFQGRKLLLRFQDLSVCWGDLGVRLPEADDVAQIIDFARGVEEGHLLTHCVAGISRSTAAALIVMAVHRRPEDAFQMGTEIQTSRPQARPNTRMLALADEQLGWEGALAALGGRPRTRVNYLWRGVG
jgi:predicted protein tyrosine phosphatase